jgi:hypothetical protein
MNYGEIHEFGQIHEFATTPDAVSGDLVEYLSKANELREERRRLSAMK